MYPAPPEDCPEGGYDPAPVDVAVEEVSVLVNSTAIVVDSTTDEYFVLYVQPDLDSDREIVASVKVGQNGTTVLTEQLSPLPKEHYRVEKYLIANPADVDGDCIDDITELHDPVGMNPVNSAPAVPLVEGAVAVPDRETFETIASNGVESLAVLILGLDTDRPAIYFTDQTHIGFIFRNNLRGNPLYWEGRLHGVITYQPDVIAPNGHLGVYQYNFVPNAATQFAAVSLAHELLAASMPLVDNNLAYRPMWPIPRQAFDQQRALYDVSRVNVLLEEDILGDVDFISFNREEGYGFLRVMSLEERPNPRDIVIYETLPNELSRVSGIITTVPQTPLSHVNLRAVQDGVPNAYIRDALDDDDIDDLIGGYVHYAVTEDGYSIRAATRVEVDAHYAASRPAQTQTPERNLTVTQITGLDHIEFDDWNAFGVKAANLAVLRTLGFPEGTVPDGFAVPFYFYDEFMKHNEFYEDIEDMLADPDFQSDFDMQEDELKKLRKKIKKGESPQWMIDALVAMHDTFLEGQSLRYRSSTNNEDLPGFSGAGLYDSKTQKPDETEKDGIDKSLKQVYASLWNFRAFTEREFHRIDHMAAAMGVLVHPNFSDELANGVAVTFNPMLGGVEGYYVNTQIGEDLVTNPEALSVPEEILLLGNGTYEVLVTSNRVERGQLLMTDAQLEQLRRHLETIHDDFAELYGIKAGEPFAMEIEFKITSDDILSIKQARPWVFNDGAARPSNSPATGLPTISGAAQAGETLTADTSGIADEDGLDHAAFAYQWARNDGDADANIEDATGLTYTLLAADVGKTITVRASFTDDAGNQETLTSEATAVVAYVDGPPGAPREVKVRAGDTELQVYWQPPAEENKAPVEQYRILYREEGGSNQELHTAQLSQTIGSLTNGVTYRVQVTARNTAGYGTPSDELSQTPETLPLWSADMLVVEYTSVAIGADSADLFSYVGGSAGLQVKSLWSYTPDRDLRLEFTEGVAGAADLTLQVGDLTLEFPAVSSGQSSFRWKDVDVDWEDGQTLAVRIVPTTATVAPQPNSPATGQPTISGKAQVGETLTADTTGIADADGLDNPSFTYQWMADDTDIDGATDSTYTLADSDQGKAIKVRVSFTDDAGNDETLTSAETAAVAARPNTPATGAPTIIGTAQVGETLTADTTGIADADGLDNAVFGYQWIADDADIQDETVSTYTLVTDDEGKAIKVRVSFTDDATNEETLTSAATAAVEAAPNSPATGAPAISGTAQVGETLTADVSSIADSDGLTNVSYSYQWIRNDGTNDADIGGQTGSTYILTDEDVGKSIKVRVSFSDDAGNQETLTSAATLDPVISASVSKPETPTNFSGEAVYHRRVALDWDDVAAADSYQVQFYHLESESLVILPFQDNTIAFDESSAVVDNLPEGLFWWFQVRAANSVGTSEWSDVIQLLPTKASDWETGDDNSPATGLPTISGTAQVGETLTADTSGIADADGLTSVSYSYQWVANDGNADADIQDATDLTYKVSDDDVGKTIKVRVSFKDNANNEESLTSEATAVVAATVPGAPEHLTVSPHDTQALDLSWHAPDSNGGSDVTGYKVQWRKTTGSLDTPADVSEEKVTGTTHTINGLTEGVQYTVRVVAVNDVGEGRLSSEARGTPRETVPPQLDTATVNGATLTLNYNELLDATSIPAADTFEVKAGGDGHEVQDVSVESSVVTLTLASAVASEDTVTVSYTPPTDQSWHRVRDVAGNAATGFGATRATNETEDEESTTSEVPTRLSVSPRDEGMRLSWTAPEDSTVTGYQILRQRPYECEPTLMVHVDDTGTTATTFIDPDLDRNVRYTYRVKAINGDKISSWSNFATSQYFAPKHVKKFGTPSAPHSLDSVSTVGGIELTWEPPNGEEGITGYQILRKRPEECETSMRVHVENTGSTSTTLMDEDVEVGTKYVYSVAAINANGHGEWSIYASSRQGNGQVVMMSAQDFLTIAPGTKTSFSVSASHLPRDNDPDTVDYILRGDVTDTESGEAVDSCEHTNLGTDIEITVVDGVYVQYSGKFGGPGCMAGDYKVHFVVTNAGTNEKLAGTLFYYKVTREWDEGPLGTFGSSNNPATGLPIISGTAQVDETLTADTSGIADADGLSGVTYNYQWLSSRDTEIQGATDATYILTDNDAGKAIKVRVSFTDDTGNEETLTSAATDTVAAAATVPGQPKRLNVSLHEAGALDLYWEAPASDGGSPVTGYRVQWKEASGSWDAPEDVSQETVTGTSHILTGLTGGVQYAVRVMAANEFGEGPASAEKTGIPRETRAPEKVRSRVDGATLRVLYDEALDEGEGSAPPPYAFDVRVACRCDSTNWRDEEARREVDSVSVDGDTVVLTLAKAATAEDYVVVSYTPPSDAAAARTRDLAGNPAAGFGFSQVFNDTEEVGEVSEEEAPAQNSPATGLPTISGTAQVDETLTADTTGIADEDGLEDASFTYQWIRSDGGADTDISGETASTYTLVLADLGKTVRVRVSFTDDADHDEALTSAATETVAAQPNNPATGSPAISGTAQVGETLTADTSGIADADGLDNAAFTYQWVRNDGTADADIPGATASTYTPSDEDVGKTIKVRVSFADDAGNGESLTGEATAAVEAAPNSPATGAPAISGVAQVGKTLTADVSGIDDADGLTNGSYSYQWIRSDGNDDTDISGELASTYTLVSTDQGKTIKVRVSFTDDRGHGETLTSAATYAVAGPPPEPLTASLENRPEAHDGEAPFTFELRFSEEFELSYKTLRDHAFTVSGGEVKKAQRMDRDSDTPNIRWLITVEPGGNGDVTITLPVTTDCAGDGAICTEDGRRLSNRLELTVSGPSG